jgi:transcriptional regulator with XRE-family HTH domain
MMTDFGILLKTFMIKKRMTQYKLSKELGCSQSQLSAIFNGKTDPDMAFLIRCKEFFSLNIEDSIELFRKAFASSKSITIDKAYLPQGNENWLIETLIFLLLYNEKNYTTELDIQIEKAFKLITDTVNDKNLSIYFTMPK